MANMIPISTVTVGSGGVANISFSNIPQIYTDLYLLISLRTTRSATSEGITLSYNSSTTGRGSRRIYSTGAAVASDTHTTSYAGQAVGSTATSNTFSNIMIFIPNYTLSNDKSSFQFGTTENNATTIMMDANANIWASSAPIDSITLTPENSGTIVQYSSATLYGIRKY